MYSIANKKLVISANTSWYLFNFRKNLIIHLLESGYEVLALAPKDEYSVKLNELGCGFHHINIDQRGTNPLVDLKTIIEFYRFYKNYSPAVVLNFTPKNNIYSSFAANLLGIPVVNNIAGLGTAFISEKLIAKVTRLLYRITQRNAHKIFFQNEEDRSLFLNADIVPAEITERIPGSGVDLERFTPSQAPNDGITRFLLVARLLYEKGIREYIEAARLLKAQYDDVEFLLLGFIDKSNPSSVKDCEIRGWQNEGVVIYLGHSDHVEEHIAKADCVVLPSYYREGVPKSLLESAAMAKLIVTTNSVGCRDTVEDGVTGFLCEPRNVEDLCEKMELIIQMCPQERDEMGKKARERMELRFNENLILQWYARALRRILVESIN